MAETVSPAAGRRYGVARVCRVWGVPRSSFYAAHTTATRPPVAPARRGPKPTIAGAGLLAAIRADLARPGPERATARSGRACACSTASASRAGGYCG